MRVRQFACVGLLLSCAVGATLVGAQQAGVGQSPSGLPLTVPIRERGSSVTPAFEGWYYEKDGSQRVLVGYFNRNTKQEFDIPVGPNNHIDPGPADQGQPTHFNAGRAWGVFTIPIPKDFGDKKLSWTIVANGFTNTITLHTKPDYIVEPFEDAANKMNPDPDQWVGWGDRTFDEMGHAWLNITYYNDDEFKAETAARAAKTVNSTAGDRQQQ